MFYHLGFRKIVKTQNVFVLMNIFVNRQCNACIQYNAWHCRFTWSSKVFQYDIHSWRILPWLALFMNSFDYTGNIFGNRHEVINFSNNFTGLRTHGWSHYVKEVALSSLTAAKTLLKKDLAWCHPLKVYSIDSTRPQWLQLGLFSTVPLRV